MKQDLKNAEEDKKYTSMTPVQQPAIVGEVPYCDVEQDKKHFHVGEQPPTEVTFGDNQFTSMKPLPPPRVEDGVPYYGEDSDKKHYRFGFTSPKTGILDGFSKGASS